VRCIVTSLTDEEADLYGELQRATTHQASSSSSGSEAAGASTASASAGGDGGGIGGGGDGGGGNGDDEDGGWAGAANWQPRLRSSDALLGKMIAAGRMKE
jgi:hypothetical protein